MDKSALVDLITTQTGATPKSISPLSGGCVADVMRADFDDGRQLVIKQSNTGDASLSIEATMLRYFKAHSPINCPDVVYADESCLVMTYIANDNRMSQSVQLDLAEQLAAQHQITSHTFGLDFDTLIGGLPQPNTSETDWITFFAEHRLRHMAQRALHDGKLPDTMAGRIDRLIDRLDRYLPKNSEASLLHGDLWGGNIPSQSGKLAGLIDPAIYYGDREIELAFGTLFGDLTPEFFERYSEILPISPGFFEERRDLYNLYPLLVHVCLFGGHYVRSVDHILARFGQ
ncbi:fructosamine kinase family protein [Thalassospira sp. HF15]|uniref:fructosamine kinase family protein n=1 Tax=Thalassospira sp. HF15 TaxID=2722755 RepID=UPI0014316B9B|nr:fructosamine kinase family protein [Thalassospira sp. HF15]NIY74706.1 fructosamine kinase family protein [Thalassospira sp. HF15]